MGDPDRPARFRLVLQGEERSARAPRRSPGAAVLLILFYALLFAAGLWWLRARSPLFLPRSASSVPPLRPRSARAAAHPSRSSGTADSTAARASSPAGPDRAAGDRHSLLAGEGLGPGAHEEYDRRLSSQRCTCGCDLALRACLARDSACARSTEIAEKIRKSLS